MEKKKRLICEVPEVIHTEVKYRTAFRNVSIKKWILEAIVDKIKKEKSYE